jgi:hypothetical protein
METICVFTGCRRRNAELENGIIKENYKMFLRKSRPELPAGTYCTLTYFTVRPDPATRGNGLSKDWLAKIALRRSLSPSRDSEHERFFYGWLWIRQSPVIY